MFFVRPTKQDDDDDDDDIVFKKHRQTQPVQSQTLKDVIHEVQKKHPVVVAEDQPRQHPLLHGTLKGYQKEGVAWVTGQMNSGLGTILADEMGLGKTLEAIAVMLETQSTDSCVCVICPLSVVQAWVDEFSHFAPHLQVLRYIGSKAERDEMVSKYNERLASSKKYTPAEGKLYPCLGTNVIVTTPEITMSDAFFLSKLEVAMLVFDEAHRLKNMKSKLYQLLLTSFAHIPRRLLLTGTPIHNNALEFFALLRMSNPGIFDNVDISCLQEAPGSNEYKVSFDILRKLKELLLLRRLKKDVLAELPPLHEIIVNTPMAPLQQKIYLSLLTKNTAAVLKGSKTSLMNTVMQLRKVCNHPYMFDGVEPEPFSLGDHIVRNSGKLSYLDCLLQQLQKEGRQVLVFSQFTYMLDILQDYLYLRGWNCERLDGSVRGDERFEAVKAFQTDKETFVFLLSTRAGGVGLTLTAADTVIFYDSDWNPQMDMQAMQRAHRIGQDRTVTVYRLITEDTVEEVILLRAYKKLRVSESILEGDAQASSSSNKEEIRELIKCGANVKEESMSAEEWGEVVRKLTAESILKQSKRLDFSEVTDALKEEVYCWKGKDYADAVRKGEKVLHQLEEKQEAAPEADVDEFGRQKKVPSLSEIPVRQKRTEKQRIERLQKAWAKSGYESCSVPLDEELYATDGSLPFASSISQRATSTAPEESKDAGEQLRLKHLTGDVTKPCRVQGPHEIALSIIPVNNSGRWGRGGLFSAVSLLHSTVGAQYEAAKENTDLRMGDVHAICVNDQHLLFLCVVQKSQTATHHDGGDIDTKALEVTLERAKMFIAHQGSPCSVHFPHIPGISHDDSYKLEKLLRKYLSAVPCFMYYFKRGGRGEAAAEIGGKRKREETTKVSNVNAKAKYEQLQEGTFCFYGFSDQTTPLRPLQRKVLLHGGVLCSLEEVKTDGKHIIVVPCKDFRPPANDLTIMQLHDEGVPVVDPSWISHRENLA